MSSIDQTEGSRTDSAHTATNSQNSINRTNVSLLSSLKQSECKSATVRADGTYTGSSSVNSNLPLPDTTPASTTLTTISNTPTPTAIIVAPRIPQLPIQHSVDCHTTQQHNGNNELFPNATNPHSSMLQPLLPLQPPLVVDSALLRQRQLAVTSASNVANHQQPRLPPYSHLRSGKWLPAEENYALLLVALFERGLIKDCVDGTTTLRTYLSQKLHCAPMRISKKFAGRGIGKLTYTSKAPSLSDQQNIPELLQRLRVAEQQFLLAAYPTSVAASLGAIPFPLLPVPQTLPQPMPVFPPAIMPGMVASTTSTTPPPPLPPPHIMAPIVVGSSNITEGHTTELHKSYLRALEQADDEASKVGAQNQSSSHPVMHAIPQPLVSTIPQTAAEIPDLLSGFEKVVQGMKGGPQVDTDVAASLPNNSNQDYSPPFTSRSFDEFHRFLGKDEISLLDTSTTAATQPENPQMNQNSHVTTTTMDNESILPTPAIALDTAALFTAESYAMLVKENGHRSDLQSFSISCSHNVYEVENILQQVQAHRDHHEPPTKSETMSSHSSYCERFTGMSPMFHGHSNTNPPIDVTISRRPSNVEPLSNPSSSKNYTDTMIMTANASNRNHHVTASSQSEDANIVSGSEPSGGSSSSRSNTSNTSSGTDTAGTTSNEDDGSEEEGLTSSGGEFDSAEDDDNINNTSGHDQQQSPSSSSNSPPRKRVKASNKHQQRSERGKPKKVQFQ